MREDSTTIVLDSDYSLSCWIDKTWRYENAPVGKQWWLLCNNIPVAHLKTLGYSTDSNGECRLMLCDVEVRESYRGQGLTRTLISAVEKIEGQPMWTSGGFTPLGAQALSWMRVCPWDTPGVKYKDMAFVQDWDTMSAIN